jgi:signal transduction histidine kinase
VRHPVPAYDGTVFHLADLRRLLVAQRPLLLDVALATALLIPSLSFGDNLHSPANSAGSVLGTEPVWWIGTAVLLAALLGRRRWPLPALVLATIGAAAHQILIDVNAQPVDLALPVTLYTFASTTRHRRTSLIAVGLILAGEYAISLINLLQPVQLPPAKAAAAGLAPQIPDDVVLAAFSDSITPALVLVVSFALGDAVRSRRAHLRVVEQRAEDLQREQHQRVALATAAERARITRELHDVVAHGLSVMVVQAQGAAAALHRHPERTEHALQNVIATGQASLAEMSRLLDVVRRDPTDDPGLNPQPGLASLPALVEQVRAAGTPVRLLIDGQPVPLPAGIDLSAYRIAQEALTNTIKHGGAGATVAVTLGFHHGLLEIDVIDDGVGGPYQDGNGLRGIAERVAMLGGALAVGPRDGGGFRVRAQLPLHPAGTLA